MERGVVEFDQLDTLRREFLARFGKKIGDLERGVVQSMVNV